MRFLADESLETAVVAMLRGAGYDVAYVSEEFAGAGDERVLRRAAAKRRVLITNDKDFAALAFSQRMPSAGIVLVRMPQSRSRTKAERLLVAIRRHGERLAGAMTVVEAHTTRRRALLRRSDSRRVQPRGN